MTGAGGSSAPITESRPLQYPVDMRAALALVFVSCVGATSAGEVPDAPRQVAARARLQLFASDLEMPVALVAAPGDPQTDRLFVVEKVGRVRAITGGKVDRQAALDIAARISTGTEQGLLGLAFHPQWATNGRFYVNYTDRDGDTRVVEWKMVNGRADPRSERAILHVPQPWSNHNGGHLLFGPDGKLWIGLGDGGSRDDPHGNGQDPKALLGKMLLVDVDAERPQVKIHFTGLRNPWRYAFDRRTGALYIADVGQDKWEEVDVLAGEPALRGGANFGWDIAEGLHCHEPTRGCRTQGLVQPVVEYSHKEGCSITGGLVYRGTALPELDGTYFYADYCTALIRGFKWVDGKVTAHYGYRSALDPESRVSQVSSFGEDARGELYILSLAGSIWKLVPR